MKLKTKIAEDHVEERDSGGETTGKEKVVVDYFYYEKAIFKVTKYIEKNEKAKKDGE